jgi:hypothetical protein
MLVEEVVIAYVVENMKPEKCTLNTYGYAHFTLLIKATSLCSTNTFCCNPEWKS